MAEARTMEKSELEAKNVAELQEIAGGLGIEGLKGLRKGQLVDAYFRYAPLPPAVGPSARR